MLQKLLQNKTRVSLALLLVVFLMLIRMYENNLFYDPLLRYFRSEFNSSPLPEINKLNLFFGFLFRYSLNTLFSLGIIYVLLKDTDAIKFATILYVVFFVLLVIAFFFVLSFFGENSKMVLFYIRRFLIQPLFLLLFLPAFYYQRIKE